jgi:dolichol-phosphate mannosyltransferase
MKNIMLLSVVIPAYNEADNLDVTVNALTQVLIREEVPFEIIVVNDNSSDNTSQVIDELKKDNPNVVRVDRMPPGGYGRAVRSGLEVCRGEVIIIYMADNSDDPEDVVRYYRKLEEGYDCVFGSRFMGDSKRVNYPLVKLLVNRLVNFVIRLMFWCRFNDLTNAFKAYRREVVEDCGPYHSCHFNLTVEMSLNALIRKYNIAQIPINWYGRTWGCSKMSIRQMGRRYLEVVIKCYVEKMLISDDLVEEKIKKKSEIEKRYLNLENRVDELAEKLDEFEKKQY